MISFLAIFGLVLAVVIAIGYAIDRYRRWDLVIKPYECYPCRRRYETPQQLVAHMHGNHGVDFDDHEVTVIKGYTLGDGK